MAKQKAKKKPRSTAAVFIPNSLSEDQSRILKRLGSSCWILKSHFEFWFDNRVEDRHLIQTMIDCGLLKSITKNTASLYARRFVATEVGKMLYKRTLEIRKSHNVDLYFSQSQGRQSAKERCNEPVIEGQRSVR